MKLSVQLYTVRDQLASDANSTLAKIRDMGLEYVEGGGTYGAETPEAGRELLDRHGLKASGSHVGLGVLETDLHRAIAETKTMGAPFIIVPWLDREVYANGWDQVAARLEPIAQEIKNEGLQLAYHNHDFEFKNEGKPGLEVLYDSCDPALVKAELDLAWVAIGGGDPVEWIKKLANRLPLVHLKDYDPTQKPQWRPAGQGIIDWDGCLAAANEAGVEFGAIELDESPGDPLEAVRESVDFFRKKGVL